MALIKSISGIRGTIGGMPHEGLTPVDIIKFTAAYGQWLLDKKPANKIVVGRDARISGVMLSRLVSTTLQAMGIDVVDLGLSTTPTVGIAVPMEKAGGGIILTASHNPKEWNALKLLNDRGEFVSFQESLEIMKYAAQQNFTFAAVDKLGSIRYDNTYIEKHIKQILDILLVDVAAIKNKQFRIVIDCVNSTGSIALPLLLDSLGVAHVEKLYCEPNGCFPHNPEPLPEHITEICNKVREGNYDLGIIVDPDVDRLAFVSENGMPFGEEYTLVAVADYILQYEPGNTVSNLSSTRALKDITEKAGQQYFASAVGEVNVVEMMKSKQAVIGGEGNGGIIYPPLHYGRDAMVGIALFLSHLAHFSGSIKALRESYPSYVISKNKIQLTEEMDIDQVLEKIKLIYRQRPISATDGVKIEFEHGWVHLRKSNTEPIIRIYAESTSKASADALAERIIENVMR